MVGVHLVISAACIGWMVYWFSLAFTTFSYVCDGFENNTVIMYLVADISRIVLSVALFASMAVYNAVADHSLKRNVTLVFAAWALLLFTWDLVYLAGDVEGDKGECLASQANNDAWKAEVEEKLGTIDNYGSKAIYNMALMYNPKNWCRSRMETITGKASVGLQQCLRYHTGDFVPSTENAIAIDIILDLCRLVGCILWFYDAEASKSDAIEDATSHDTATTGSVTYYLRAPLRRRSVNAYTAVPTSSDIRF
jgi:hypothetical protein